MTADDTDDLCRMVRYRSCPAVCRRKIRTASPILTLAGAVGIHMEKIPRIIMRSIRIFPSKIHHLAVSKNTRMPVTVLLVCKLPDRTFICIDLIQISHRLTAVFTRQTLNTRRRANENLPVFRKIATVKPLNIFLIAGSKFFKVLPVGINLQNRPHSVSSNPGKHQLFA